MNKADKIEYKAVLKRDNNQCVICNRSPVAIHHVLYRSLGGANIRQNMVCLCHSHHSYIHELGKVGMEKMLEYLRIHYGMIDRKDLKKKGKYSDYAIPN